MTWLVCDGDKDVRKAHEGSGSSLLIGVREKCVLIVVECSGDILSGFDYGMVVGKELWRGVVRKRNLTVSGVRMAFVDGGWDGSVELN